MATITNVPKKNLAEKLATLDKIAKKMNEKIGKKIMGRIGNDAEILDRLTIKFIPTPCADLNAAVGGGFPRRRCTIIAGKPDSGKTSLVLETIAINQKKDPEFVAGWLESENSLKKEYLCDTFGIDPDRFFYIPLDKSIGAEKTLDIVQGVLEVGAIDLFCINSLKCLVPNQEMEASLGDAVVAVQARMNARMTRKFTPIVAEYDTAFILITHLSTEIGTMSRDPMIIAGGQAIAYWSQLTLDLRKHSMGPNELIGRDEGVKISVTVKKNHCVPDRNPYLKLEYYAVFGEGIEQILTSLDGAIEQGVVEMHGNWIWWMEPGSTEPLQKWSGKQTFRTYMKTHPEDWEKFQAMLEGEYTTVEDLTEEEVQAIKMEEAEICKIANDAADIKKKSKKKEKAAS
jgi:recombination protein RecA